MTETEEGGCRVYVVNTPVPDEIRDVRVDNAFHKELRDEFMDSREEPIKSENCSLLSTVARLYSLMSRSDKLRLLGIFAATLILSMIETVGISVIMPFITLATSPERILDNKYSSAVYHFFGFTSTLHFMVVFAGCLIGFYIFRALYNIYYSYVTNLFSFYHYHSFSLRLFGKILETTCLRFEFTSKDRIRQIVTAEAQNTANFIQQILSFLSNIWTAGMLYMLLIATNWKMTLVLTMILGIQVLLVTKVMSRITKRQGRVRTKLDQEFLGLLTRTFGNFRITKLRGNQSKLFEMFDKTSTKRGRSSVLIGTLSPVPKNILETVAFSLLVASVAYILTRYDDASHVLPIISMYALALYRLLPAITSLMDRYQSMLYAQNSVNIVWETLHKTGEDAGTDMLEFNESIVLEDIDFGYSKERLVLQKVNLTINKGDRVAFTGMSGAGKSTLVDLIIGIYHPKGGKILIDGVEITPRNIDTWRRKIGYIPQQIFLYDGTVAQNIAFGDKEDEEKIINACKQANIYSFLEGHRGIHTKIGEGGVKLSGGQLQRIGIARALYNDPEVLVLDEATSALDSDTEGKVMDELYKTCEGKTMLAISHKPSTLSRCNVNVKVLSVGRAS